MMLGRVSRKAVAAALAVFSLLTLGSSLFWVVMSFRGMSTLASSQTWPSRMPGYFALLWPSRVPWYFVLFAIPVVVALTSVLLLWLGRGVERFVGWFMVGCDLILFTALTFNWRPEGSAISPPGLTALVLMELIPFLALGLAVAGMVAAFRVLREPTDAASQADRTPPFSRNQSLVLGLLFLMALAAGFRWWKGY